MDGINGVMPLQDLKRMAHVKRWQIVQTSRVQTLMEHSGLVALYALELLHRTVWTNRIPMVAMERDVLLWALIHDAPEVYTGDICALSKEAISPEGLRGLENLEKQTGPVYAGLHDDGDFIVKEVVKLADLLEACVFIAGHQPHHLTEHFQSVRGGLEDRLGDQAVKYLTNLQINGQSRLHNPGTVRPDPPACREWARQILQEART